LYNDLGRQLEELATANSGQPVEANALAQAVQAFVDAGDIESQMRVMRKALARNALSGGLLERYLALLASRQPDELLAVIRGNGSAEIRNRAVQSAFAADRPELAYSALHARGAALPPVWTRAYTALAGQYFGDRSAPIDAAFQAALDTRTIGARLKTPPKTDSVIVGSVWFYYGSRYGDYLASGANAAAEAWLPASLEAAPSNPDAYMALGDSYAGNGRAAKAIAQFEHALELDADRGDAHDRIARVLWSQGRRAEALARWKSAIAAFLAIQNRGVRVPEPFWNRLSEMFTALGERHALGELRSEIANLLGDYYQINADYRLDELIDPIARASVASGEGTDWLLELGRAMDNPEMIVSALMRAPGLTDAQRISLQRNIVAIRAKEFESAVGDNRQSAESAVSQARCELVSMLLNAGDLNGASAEWAQVPAITGPRSPDDDSQFRDEVELRLASKAGRLDSVLDRYRLHPESAPSLETLRNAALTLRRAGDENAARLVLESLYDRELRNGHLDAANFLGLAEVKLQRSDDAAAVALLNRMALVVEDGFDTLLPAAELLGRYGRTAASADFLRRRVTAEPWDAEARLQLARTAPAGSPERERLLTAALADSQAPYQTRAEAARLIAPRSVPVAAGSELALLSSGSITPEAATQPYQVEARIDAARAVASADVKLRLWQEALAIAPADEPVRSGALRAAIGLRRDSLALALAQGASSRNGPASTVLPQAPLNDDERATIAEALGAAAQRLDDLPTAQTYLRAAIELRPPDQRSALVRTLDSLRAELDRRARNAARQPAIKNVIEQDRVVGPRIPRSAP
jgi:tetratricopeptide (TPR) repeat protein